MDVKCPGKLSMCFKFLKLLLVQLNILKINFNYNQILIVILIFLFSINNCNPKLFPNPQQTLVMIEHASGCLRIQTVFSHAQSVIQCKGCTTILSTPTGGKARLRDGCSFRKKPY